MGNEIAYLMLTENNIFLGKGALPPYNPRQGADRPLRTPCSQTVLPTIQNGMMPMHRCEQRGGWGPGPHFWWQSGEKSHSGELGGSMESLVEMVQIEKALQNYVNFTLWKGLSWAFKTLKPMSFRGRNLRWKQFKLKLIDNSVRNYMWILPRSYPLKRVFLGFAKNMSFRESWTPGPPAPGMWSSDIESPVKMVQIENSLQNNMWI